MTDLVFLVDQDGPLADFDPHFHAMCRDNGWHMDVDGHHNQAHRFAEKHIVFEDHRSRAMELVESPGWFLDLPVTPGAVDGINRLAEIPGAEVWICTKPMEANPTCRNDKQAWVERHLGHKWAQRLIMAPDKGVVRMAAGVAWALRAAWVPVIFPMAWNGDGTAWDGLLRWSWDDDVNTLAEIAKANAYYSAQHHVWK